MTEASHEVIPRPDPSTLTTDQLHREIAGMEKVLVTQIHGMEALFTEKFRGIGVQFSERDTRSEQLARESKLAIDAALQAAKEAVGKQNDASDKAIAKSEGTTTRQLEQLAELVKTSMGALNDKIDDLRARVGSIEATGRGRSDSWGVFIAVAGIVTGVVALVFAVVWK